MEDWISQLPDAILVSIVSLLAIKEAARTGVLSHRWEILWKFITVGWNFDGLNTMWEIAERKKVLKLERFRYIGWVNRVLNSHQGLTAEDFRVCFDLSRRSKRYIDKWVEIVMAKRVQRLELDLSPFTGGFFKASALYTLSQNCFNCGKSPCGIFSIKHLTSICLKFVNVSGDLLEYFLSNCPLLERVCVARSEHLVNLKVADSSLQLKFLEISYCLNLEVVEICAPNLASFKYFGRRRNFHIKNLHFLRDLSIGGLYCEPINYVFPLFSSYLSQLETLMLDMGLFEENLELPQFPEFSNLRHLTWRVRTCDERSLLCLIPLIEASPFLHTFTLELTLHAPWKQRKIQKAVKCPNQYLKVVELVGFAGLAIDVELAMYLLEGAIMLEKLIVNPRPPHKIGTQWEFKETKEEQAARKCAQQLKTRLPPGAELVIL